MNFPGMLDGGGEDHHPLPVGRIPAPGSGYGGDPLLVLISPLSCASLNRPFSPRHQLAEVVVDDGGVHQARRGQVAVFHHEAQGSSDAVTKQPLAVALDHAVVVAPVDPAQPQPIGGWR